MGNPAAATYDESPGKDDANASFAIRAAINNRIALNGGEWAIVMDKMRVLRNDKREKRATEKLLENY